MVLYSVKVLQQLWQKTCADVLESTGQRSHVGIASLSLHVHAYFVVRPPDARDLYSLIITLVSTTCSTTEGQLPWDSVVLDLWNKSVSLYIVYLTSPSAAPLLFSKLFFPGQWCHPPKETQLTLLSWKGTRNANSSPPYSFHILWRWTRQLHGTIARQTVDSGWTLCTVRLGGGGGGLGCCQPVFLFYWNIRLSWQKWMLPGITNEPINQWISSAAIKLMRAGWASSSRGYILGKVINAQNRQQSTRLLLSWTILPELFLFWAKYGTV